VLKVEKAPRLMLARATIRINVSCVMPYIKKAAALEKPQRPAMESIRIKPIVFHKAGLRAYIFCLDMPHNNRVEQRTRFAIMKKTVNAGHWCLTEVTATSTAIAIK
jgi:hypothetical protein